MIRQSLSWMMVLMAVSVPGQSFAQRTEAEIRASISHFASQRHPVVPDGFWESMGESASAILRKLYPESKSAHERSFVIDGLSHFKDPETASFLQSEISRSKDDVERKKLLGALIQSQGEKSFEFVESYLNDSSPHVRKIVAHQLEHFPENPKIKKRLDEYRNSEKTPWILKDLEALKSGKPDRQKVKSPLFSTPKTESKAVETVSLAPLPEKEWVGLWRGSLVSESKIQMVDLKLQTDSKASPFKWKAELTLPNRSKKDWMTDEISIQSFVTQKAYWIEIRHSKSDQVFIAQRKAKKK